MGYSHYWSFIKINKRSSELESRYQRALSQIEKVVQGYNMHMKLKDFKHPNRLAGFTAHAPTGLYKGINFNGTKDLGHENFTLRETYHLNEPRNFCKTARKPYDIVVTAALIVLKFYMGGNVDVYSDGTREEWLDGLELATDILKLKGLEVPPTIETKEERRGVS